MITIPDDALERLPDQARSKLLLLAGLRDDALDNSRSANARLQTLLSDIARRRGDQADDPNIVRLNGVIESQRDRHESLAGLVAGCVRWVRDLPDTATIEPVTIEPPKLEKGETPEGKVMSIRAEIARLSVERLNVSQVPPPKGEMLKQVRPFVEQLAKRGAPRLRLERGKPFEAQWTDDKRDFGPSESFIAAMVAWVGGETMIERIEAMVAALPERNAMSDAEQAKRLADLGAEIDLLERAEERLVEAAFADGLDILRRRNAAPAAVLGVSPATQVSAAPSRRPQPVESAQAAE
jgi:hypothetical protein